MVDSADRYGFLVPLENLYGFLSRLASYAAGPGCYSLVWPDGRQLELAGWRSYSKFSPLKIAHGTVPVDGSLHEGFYISLPFEADDRLRECAADTEETRTMRRWLPFEHSWEANGRIRIGGIFVFLQAQPFLFDCLEGQPKTVQVTFGASTAKLCEALVSSESAQRFFLDLAHSGGALTCGIDAQGMDKSQTHLLFANGCEIENEHQHWYQYSQWGYANSEASQAKRTVLNFPKIDNPHELQKLADFVQHPDSGVRAALCFRLQCINELDPAAALRLLVALLQDKDWYVRATAAANGWKIGEPGVPFLINAISDSHSEVRIAAIEALGVFEIPEVFEIFLEQLRTLGSRQPEMGILFQALKSCFELPDNKDSVYRLIKTLQDRLEDAEFPFRAEAEYKIAWLRRWRL